MKKIYLITLLITSLFVTACDGPSGSVTANLEDPVIKNGQSTYITINGKNNGDQATEVFFAIVPEDPNKILIEYNGSLEDFLQPKEDTGDNRIKVTGYTDYTRTIYKINVYLKDKVTGKELDKSVKEITVEK